MQRRKKGVLIFAVLAGLSAVPVGASESGSLAIGARLRTTGDHNPTCPAGTADNVECHVHSDNGLVAGLGAVSTSYFFRVDVRQPECIRVLGYPVTLTVAGKGSLDLAVNPVEGCLSAEAALSASQSFTIVGGSGLYTAARGTGTISRHLTNQPAAVVGTETFAGTLIVPGVDFDTTKPTLSGATSRRVHARRGATRARVRYRVTAFDDRDGSLPVTCRPPSGTTFRIGRTTVTCSAVDTSGNKATARFVVSVRRG